MALLQRRQVYNIRRGINKFKSNWDGHWLIIYKREERDETLMGLEGRGNQTTSEQTDDAKLQNAR